MKRLVFLLTLLQDLTAQSSSLCDLNQDGSINVVDVQMAINQALGQSSCTSDLDHNGACDVVDVQRIIRAALGMGCNSGSGATVDESKEAAFVYVDAVSGSDLNPGSQQKPFQTINRAVTVAQANNRMSVGTRVIINPGTYRESISMFPTATSTTWPLTLEAAIAGTVIISGADVWTGWQAYGPNTQILTHSWPYQWGVCVDRAIPQGHTLQPIALRREMIFVNGRQLTQVIALSQMNEGTFYVDEVNQIAYIWSSAGTNADTATIEVAVRPQLLTGHNETNLVFRGLTFQYANSCRGMSAVALSSSNNILFDSVNVLWNNAAGLRFDSLAHVTAQNCKANHNGEVGLTSYKVTYALWDSDEGSYNNWRGAQGANYDLTTQGADFILTHSSRFVRLKTLYNQAHGVHWDTDAVDITADSLLSSYNYQSAAVIEASEGPVTIQNSQICNSNIAGKTGLGGINLTDASHVMLTGNTVYNNQTSQIILGGRAAGISVTNWETGQIYQVHNDNMTATNNTVVASAGQQVFRDSYLTTGWSLFGTTLSSDSNAWWNAGNSAAFMVPVPSGSTSLDLNGWQNLTHQDVHSTFTAPSTSPATACQTSPDATDYWFVVDTDSQTVPAGNSASYTVSVVPLAFNGIVSLSVDATGAPATTASYLPNSINTSGSATLRVLTSTSTPPGTYPITMIATSGSLTRTITVSLVVGS